MNRQAFLGTLGIQVIKVMQMVTPESVHTRTLPSRFTKGFGKVKESKGIRVRHSWFSPDRLNPFSWFRTNRKLGNFQVFRFTQII